MAYFRGPKLSPRLRAANSWVRFEPGSLQGLARKQGIDAMGPGPVLGPGHQILLATVGEDVYETLYLSRLFLADEDCLIASGEHFVAPAGQPADFAPT
jgi:hypothetical protein